MSGNVAELRESLGLEIDPELLVLALTHRSFAHEAGGLPTNERLEFLGDSVLGIIVTDHLFHEFSTHNEYQLSTIRAGVVSQDSLSRVARSLNLGRYLLLGKGELKTGGRDRPSILCDAMEAVIGAAYLSAGYEATRRFILRLIIPQIERVTSRCQGVDWRTELAGIFHERGMGEPQFVLSDTGPDHDKTYTATLALADGDVTGSGKSKRAALAQAAQLACEVLVGKDSAPA
ncbi:MAG: ribonuclease III [Bowdeniella nasicola]|nr:ribonuclease III [Bowdeniella nasicola]